MGLLLIALPLHDFLAVTKPVGKGILVVEAWIPPRALAESEEIFNSHHYSHLVLVGGPARGQGASAGHPLTYDDLATERLAKLGFDTSRIVRIDVPSEPTGLRILSSAEAVGHWLGNSGTPVCCVDVFTVGVHARKSWVFFRQALGDRYRVGIISGGDASPDRNRLWFLSPGALWTFIRDLAGYVYSEMWVLSKGRITL